MSSHTHGPLGLAAAVSVCADQQFGTNFHTICEALYSTVLYHGGLP